MNRTLLERVRCMLVGAGLGRQFWGEALKAACYLINMCPSAAIEFKTPQEMWTGSKPEYEHLRVFGSTAYAHIRQDKLQPRALKCIFLGYPDDVKGYRLWCIEPGHKKCIISRDVKFNENEMPFKGNIQNETRRSEDNRLNLEVETVESRSKEDNNEAAQTREVTEGRDDELLNYQLARDRERRNIKPPDRLGFADFTAFALLSAEDIENNEPSSYHEAVNGKNKE